MGMDGYDYAQKMRDIIKSFVSSEIDRLRPSPKLATVVSIDHANDKCTVKFAGESDANAVPIRMNTIRPDLAGAIVRVEGTAGNKYVTDVVSGPRCMVLVASDGTRRRVYLNTSGALITAVI